MCGGALPDMWSEGEKGKFRVHTLSWRYVCVEETLYIYFPNMFIYNFMLIKLIVDRSAQVNVLWKRLHKLLFYLFNDNDYHHH